MIIEDPTSHPRRQLTQITPAQWSFSSSFLHLAGTRHDDQLTGNEAGNWLRGGGGNDRLKGLGGHDVLLPGRGADHVEGGAGDDWIVIQQHDSEPASGHKTLKGGKGTDTLDYSNTTAGRIEVSLPDGTVTWAGAVHRVTSFERFIGTPAADTFNGDHRNQRWMGGPGSDVYWFSPDEGHDTIHDIDAVNSESTDVIRLTGGVTPDQVVLTRHEYHLLLSFTDHPDTLKLVNALRPGHEIEYVRFDDGTSYLIKGLTFEEPVRLSELTPVELRRGPEDECVETEPSPEFASHDPRERRSGRYAQPELETLDFSDLNQGVKAELGTIERGAETSGWASVAEGAPPPANEPATAVSVYKPEQLSYRPAVADENQFQGTDAAEWFDFSERGSGWVKAGAGDDLITLRRDSRVTVFGGDGIDTVSFRLDSGKELFEGGVNVSVFQRYCKHVDAGATRVLEVEYVGGTDRNDRFVNHDAEEVTFLGYGGDDTYEVGHDSGLTIIRDDDSARFSMDALRVPLSLGKQPMYFSADGSDLVIGMAGRPKVRIERWFDGPQYQVEFLQVKSTDGPVGPGERAAPDTYFRLSDQSFDDLRTGSDSHTSIREITFIDGVPPFDADAWIAATLNAVI